MAGDEELLQIERVAERLMAHYPCVPGDHITHTVRIIHKRFEAARIRSFIPLLVEKAARRSAEDWFADAAGYRETREFGGNADRFDRLDTCRKLPTLPSSPSLCRCGRALPIRDQFLGETLCMFHPATGQGVVSGELGSGS